MSSSKLRVEFVLSVDDHRTLIGALRSITNIVTEPVGRSVDYFVSSITEESSEEGHLSRLLPLLSTSKTPPPKCCGESG